jgi:hypothetical protein
MNNVGQHIQVKIWDKIKTMSIIKLIMDFPNHTY